MHFLSQGGIQLPPRNESRGKKDQELGMASTKLRTLLDIIDIAEEIKNNVQITDDFPAAMSCVGS